MVKASRPAASQFTRHAQQHHREHGEHQAEGQRRRPPCTRPAGTGRLRGAAHQGVDVGVVPHVERARGAGADGDAEDGHDRQDRVHGAPARDQAGSAVNTTSDITRGFSSAT